MGNSLTESEFVEMLTKGMVRMRSYAISLVKNPTDADDIVQNASLALWDNQEKFDADRDFFRWACGYVLIEVQRHRQKRGSDRLVFSDKTIELLSARYLVDVAVYDSRREQLHKCLSKLTDKDLALVKDRYALALKPKEISKLRELPLPTVYGALARIRNLLHRCIDTHLAQKAHS